MRLCGTSRTPYHCNLPARCVGWRTFVQARLSPAQPGPRWEEALTDWQEAFTFYEGLGDVEAIGAVCNAIGQQLGWGARFAEGLDFNRRGLIALGERVSADRCRLLASSGSGLSLAGYRTVGDGMLAEALTMAEQLEHEHLLGGARLQGGASLHDYAVPGSGRGRLPSRGVAALSGGPPGSGQRSRVPDEQPGVPWAF
jgi:hypothetical protein